MHHYKLVVTEFGIVYHLKPDGPTDKYQRKYFAFASRSSGSIESRGTREKLTEFSLILPC